MNDDTIQVCGLHYVEFAKQKHCDICNFLRLVDSAREAAELLFAWRDEAQNYPDVPLTKGHFQRIGKTTMKLRRALRPFDKESE